MARLTGLDADGDIVSVEEYSIIGMRPLTKKEERLIREHIMQKLYEYENSEEERCVWKVNSEFPDQINNPHIPERENICTTEFCPYCGKRILIMER